METLLLLLLIIQAVFMELIFDCTAIIFILISCNMWTIHVSRSLHPHLRLIFQYLDKEQVCSCLCHSISFPNFVPKTGFWLHYIEGLVGLSVSSLKGTKTVNTPQNSKSVWSQCLCTYVFLVFSAHFFPGPNQPWRSMPSAAAQLCHAGRQEKLQDT